ncbi:MAG: sporulation transcriptional regulator SpoIIID [Oscillospiraceae bacterium]|jgi:putative DeoR family transcriptional regulator (stage III sporulation protein D)|nr:sporulation transcriptional regulator SpoIIID [Firmicutes bacterium CAG:137]
MTDHIGERACQLAVYMIENRATVRAAAKKFGISKSTVHKDLSQRLPQYNQALYEQVKVILDTNKAQRHIRGGLATRKKYKGE